MSSWDEYKKTMKLENPLFQYAREGNSIQIQNLLPSISDINEKEAKGYSALMLAAYNGHLEASKILIEYGADVNTADNAGSSALMGAAFKGHLEIVKLLLEKRADPFHQNAKRLTALSFALMFGRSEVADILSQKMNLKQNRFKQTIQSWIQYIFKKQTKQGDSHVSV